MSDGFRQSASATHRQISGAMTALLLVMLLSSTGTAATLRWHWEDSFTPAEQTKLRLWITTTTEALERLTAPLPLTVHVYLHRMDGRGEPVPWANTRRGVREGIDFYVDPAWPLSAFTKDWTAAHELSHLLVPYLGERNSWFAEGFASYMQYRILQEQGVVSPREMVETYRERIETAAAKYSLYGLKGTSFTAAATRLRQGRDYPTYYWGGAVYFMAVDAQLHRAEAPALTALLSQYVDCCRSRNDDVTALTESLNTLSGTTFFTDQLAKFDQEPGFPDYEQALQWAEDHMARTNHENITASEVSTRLAP